MLYYKELIFMMLNDFEISSVTDYLFYTDPLKNDQQLYFPEENVFIELDEEKSIVQNFLYTE